MIDTDMQEVADMITEEDPEWIAGKFHGEIWLSTDGKHTIHASGEDTASRKGAILWAEKTYAALVKKYGTKQMQNVRTYNGSQTSTQTSQNVPQTAETTIPVCPVHLQPMSQGKWGWWCKNKLPDGNWCKYKPSGK